MIKIMNSQRFQRTPNFKKKRNLKYLGMNKKYNSITYLLRRILICTIKNKKVGRELVKERELVFTIRCPNL